MPTKSAAGGSSVLTLAHSFGGAAAARVEYLLDGTLVLRVDGDANVVVHANGGVTAYTKGEVRRRLPEQGKRVYRMGDPLPSPLLDWMVGPPSEAKGPFMAIEPVSSAPVGYQTWYEGQKHAEELRKEGFPNARQPSHIELDILYEEFIRYGDDQYARFNREIIDEGDGLRRLLSRHWTGTSKDGLYKEYANTQDLDDGLRNSHRKIASCALVRCVCDIPKEVEIIFIP